MGYPRCLFCNQEGHLKWECPKRQFANCKVCGTCYSGCTADKCNNYAKITAGNFNSNVVVAQLNKRFRREQSNSRRAQNNDLLETIVEESERSSGGQNSESEIGAGSGDEWFTVTGKNSNKKGNKNSNSKSSKKSEEQAPSSPSSIPLEAYEVCMAEELAKAERGTDPEELRHQLTIRYLRGSRNEELKKKLEKLAHRMVKTWAGNAQIIDETFDTSNVTSIPEMILNETSSSTLN